MTTGRDRPIRLEAPAGYGCSRGRRASSRRPVPGLFMGVRRPPVIAVRHGPVMGRGTGAGACRRELAGSRALPVIAKRNGSMIDRPAGAGD